jgi:NAD(P)-dependent dehydrogenase (short-subunit alcohol dehydrogenase family)
VIYGVHVFLPHMLQRGSGYIVNTSSAGGLGGGLDPSIPYTTTKFAVVGLTEGLAVYLRDKGIGVSVLCPNYVATNMYFVGGRRVPASDPALNELWERFRNDPQRRNPEVMRENNVLPAEAVADQVVEAIKTNRYFILTHDFMREMVLTRAQDPDQFVETVAGWARERTERVKALLSGKQGTGGA